jgi:hypothetical protein
LFFTWKLKTIPGIISTGEYFEKKGYISIQNFFFPGVTVHSRKRKLHHFLSQRRRRILRWKPWKTFFPHRPIVSLWFFSSFLFWHTRHILIHTHTHTCHAIVNSSFWCVSLLAWHSIRNKKGKQKEQKFLATLMIEVEVIALSRFRSTSHARWRCVVRSFVQKIKNGREEEKEKKRRSGVVAMYL